MKDEKHCVNLGVWMVRLGTSMRLQGSKRQFSWINVLTPLRPPELCPNNRASAVESPHRYKCILSLLKSIKKHMSALKRTQSTEKERYEEKMWVYHVPKDDMMDWHSCCECFCSFNTNPCSRIEMLHWDSRWHVNPVDRHHLLSKPTIKMMFPFGEEKACVYGLYPSALEKKANQNLHLD